MSKTIVFDKDCIGEVVQDEETITLKDVDIVQFMTPLWDDEHVEEFLNNPGIQDIFMARFFTKETLERGLAALKEREEANHG